MRATVALACETVEFDTGQGHDGPHDTVSSFRWNERVGGMTVGAIRSATREYVRLLDTLRPGGSHTLRTAPAAMYLWPYQDTMRLLL
jgi:hypothetical protein